jgi:hypothetical protein
MATPPPPQRMYSCVDKKCVEDPADTKTPSKDTEANCNLKCGTEGDLYYGLIASGVANGILLIIVIILAVMMLENKKR